jgi:hypothetical protein
VAAARRRSANYRLQPSSASRCTKGGPCGRDSGGLLSLGDRLWLRRAPAKKPRRSEAKSLGEVWAGVRPVTVLAIKGAEKGAGKPDSLTASGRIGFTALQRKSPAEAGLKSSNQRRVAPDPRGVEAAHC